MKKFPFVLVLLSLLALGLLAGCVLLNANPEAAYLNVASVGDTLFFYDGARIVEMTPVGVNLIYSLKDKIDGFSVSKNLKTILLHKPNGDVVLVSLGNNKETVVKGKTAFATMDAAGKLMAYQKDGIISVAPIGGGWEPKQIRPGIKAYFSPDSMMIAVQTRGNEIQIIHLDDTTRVSYVFSDAENPTWSPDSKKIAYHSNSMNANSEASLTMKNLVTGAEQHFSVPAPVEMTWSTKGMIIKAKTSSGTLRYFILSDDGTIRKFP